MSIAETSVVGSHYTKLATLDIRVCFLQMFIKVLLATFKRYKKRTLNSKLQPLCLEKRYKIKTTVILIIVKRMLEMAIKSRIFCTIIKYLRVIPCQITRFSGSAHGHHLRFF